MSFQDLLVISLAVSLDAFGVAMAIGLNGRLAIRQRMLFAISFGMFQFIFSYAGGIGGKLFSENIAEIPSIVGGIIIAIVGALMVKDGFENKDDEFIESSKMYFIIGISVSIDASVVGFITLSRIGKMAVLVFDTVFIGLFTFVMSIIAFIVSRYLRKIDLIGRFADYIGGIILILFGLKMIFF